MNTTWTPVPGALPWDPQRGSLVCPGCPDHHLATEGRYEVAVEGIGLDGLVDHRDALRLVRRAPDFGSGPFGSYALPEGMAVIAVIDYLERQTFDAQEAAALAEAMRERFPDAVIHVWAIGTEVGHRIAEDASWFADEGLLIRSPVEDIAPHAFPMDVGWAPEAEHVETADGPVELWRGCLYVEPIHPELVRYGWVDLPGPPAA